MHPFIVGWTGASGILYGVRLVEVLTALGHRVELVVSDAARLVLREEQGLSLKSLNQPESFSALFEPQTLERVVFHSHKDFTAPIASGSYPVSGMVIIPCSMGTLGAVASGISQNLIHRAADCCMKEGRKLAIVPRETPLNAIHLENMLKLARLGVSIVPAAPGFYSGAARIEDLVDFMVGKVLDQFGIPHALYPRWTGRLRPLSTQGSL